MPVPGFYYTKALRKVRQGSIDMDSNTLKCGLSTTAHVPNKGHEFCSDGFSAGELNVTGYTPGFGSASRKVIAFTVADDLVNNRVLDSTVSAPKWTALGTSTIGQGTILKEVTADSDSPVIINLGIPNTDPGGFDFEFNFNGTVGYHQV